MAVTISGTSGINQDSIGTAPIKSFTSANQAIPTAASQLFSVSHGLGSTPRLVRIVAVCLTANNGWAVGDETQVLFNAVDNGTYQTMPWANATTVGWTSGSGISIINRTNYYLLNIINNTNWALKVYAFA
jgi:hypothetical protein